jgi:histidyl-tRNA synthetase
MLKPQTLKGFRDFLPVEAKKRQYVINTLKKVVESYGFEPLETPALEYEEILTGKYGDEGDKLLYRFEDNGKRRVAMRYDQTVPLARVVAQYQNTLPLPFKRYQIQPVWRAENTQKGRFREFLQCDIDTIGSPSLLTDAEIISCVLESVKKFGFKNAKMLINDRSVFKNLKPSYITAIDKLEKIGAEAVIQELTTKGMDQASAQKLIYSFNKTNPTPHINILFKHLQEIGLIENKDYQFKPDLARGLDYYTSTIFELKDDTYTTGSLGGGGRYDNLIGMFTDKQIPAVGFAFGFDRIIEAMKALQLFPPELATSSTKVLVTIFSEELKQKTLAVTSQLRAQNINSEIYLGEIKDKNQLDKQLKYGDQKQIPYAIILGPEEAEKNVVTLKNLKTRDQRQIPVEKITELLK